MQLWRNLAHRRWKTGRQTSCTSGNHPKVDRWTSLDKAPFEERMGECGWQLALCIPKEAFFRHQLKGFKGMTAHANFYKCGDLQHTPHFLSWNKIDLPKPCFHCPEFFGKIMFE